MRLKPLQRTELSERQRATYDRLTNGPRQSVSGPFIAWLRSPELADRAGALGDYLRFESNLSPAIRELVILMVARSWNAAFVWEAHRSLAIDAGISVEILDAIRQGREPSFPTVELSAVYWIIEELLTSKRVSDYTWHDALNKLGEGGIADLLGLAGYYSMVVLTVVATELGGESPNPFVA